MAKVRQIKEALERKAELAKEAGERIEAEFEQAQKAWHDNRDRLEAEGLALEKSAYDSTQKLAHRLFCIQAALRRWHELHSLESNWARLYALIIKGNSRVEVEIKDPDDRLQQLIEHGERLQSTLEEALTSKTTIRHLSIIEETLEVFHNIPIMKQRDYAILFHESGLSLTQLREAISNYIVAHGGEVAPSFYWPAEKWKGSPEESSRKQHAVVRFLRRVWKPFLDECGFPVTRPMVAEQDAALADAVTAYVKLNPLPEDIRIVRTRDLKKVIPPRPTGT
jgi:hypothetical protein